MRLENCKTETTAMAEEKRCFKPAMAFFFLGRISASATVDGKNGNSYAITHVRKRACAEFNIISHKVML